MKEAVIVVDMLNDFVYGKLACDRGLDIIPNLKSLLDAARQNGRPVIFVNDAHLPSDPQMRLWGEHALKGTKEAEVIPDVIKVLASIPVPVSISIRFKAPVALKPNSPGYTGPEEVPRKMPILPARSA